jgi:protein-tyrosine phosphatase
MRRRLLFRSDALGRLTPSDLRVVQQLGLRTIVDLRTDQERASHPDRLPAGSAIRCVHLPMRDPATPDTKLGLVAWLAWHGPSADFEAILRRHYHAFAFHCTKSVGALLHCLADPANLPALVHCTGGKDRTGFTMAVLLLLLGTCPHDVIADHLATNEFLQPSLPRFVKSVRWLSLGRVSARQVMPLFETRAEHIQDVVEQVRSKHGSIQGWLEQACGVDLTTQQRLAQLFIGEGTPLTNERRTTDRG